MNRWATLKRNTSWGERLSLGFFAVLFVVLAALSLGSIEALGVFLAGMIGFGAPWLVRNQLVEHCEPVSRALQIAWYVMIGISIMGKSIRESIGPDKEMLFALALFGMIGLYMGTYFWLFSDDRIERRAAQR